MGPNVNFDCAFNAISIGEFTLDRAGKDADVALFKLIRQFADKLLSERKSQIDIVEKTRRAITMLLEDGDAALEPVAAELGMSTTLLQAKLAQSGETFDAILQETRRALLEQYLRDTDLPLTEIAFLIGYSELSAMTRAANRWFGMAPSQYRRGLRGLPIDMAS